MIIWCMVPDVWSKTDTICCHFGLLFALLNSCGPRKSKFWKKETITWRYRFTQVYHKWQSYHAWFLRYGVPRTELFVILNHFLLFNPTKNPENENFEKKKKYNNNNKKMPGDNIILHVYSKWQSYDVSFLRLGAGQTFFVILDHFLPF